MNKVTIKNILIVLVILAIATMTACNLAAPAQESNTVEVVLDGGIGGSHGQKGSFASDAKWVKIKVVNSSSVQKGSGDLTYTNGAWRGKISVSDTGLMTFTATAGSDLAKPDVSWTGGKDLNVTGSGLSVTIAVSPTYSVSYDGNGNSDGTAPSDTNNYLSGATVTVLGNSGSLVKTGKAFAGWNTVLDGTGTSYAAASTFSMPANNLILYAKWETATSSNLSVYSPLTITRSSDTDLRTFAACNIRIANFGPDTLISDDLLVEFYLSSNTTIGDADDIKIGDVTRTYIDLPMNNYQGLDYNTTQLDSMRRLWTSDNVANGSYYVYAKVSIPDGNPTDPTPSNNALMTASPFTYTGKTLANALGMQTLSGTPANLSAYNQAMKYSILSPQPGSSQQGNNVGTAATYSYELSTAIAPLGSILGSMSYEPKATVFAKTPESSVFGADQQSTDLAMRAAENNMLSSRAPQLSRSAQKGISKAAPAGIAIGTTWNSVNIVSPSATTIDTTCRYISTHAYFFVDNRNISTMESSLSAYGSAFDTIYGIDRDKFGTENDVDTNGKVIIVISEALGGSVLGYFYSGDKYPKTTYSNSNEGDIFYLNVTATRDQACGTLAHEFQHMIYFDQHYNRSVTSTYTWLNEALSQGAEYYNGYLSNHLAWINSFLKGGWKGLSLTYWTSQNYGYGAIFMRYLIDQYSDATIIKNMCSTDKIGIDAVEAATGASFSTIFTNFTKALVVSGTGDSADSLYNFKTLNLATNQPTGRGGLLPEQEFAVGNTSSGTTLLPYAISFNKWRGSFGTMTLSGSSIVGTAFGASQ